jgi:hypothetical protein
VSIERSLIEEAGEYDLEALFVRLGYAVDSIGAKRVLLDSIEALFAGLEGAPILRSELRRLFRWLKERKLTAIIAGERGQGALTRHGLEEYISDCVILPGPPHHRNCPDAAPIGNCPDQPAGQCGEVHGAVRPRADRVRPDGGLRRVRLLRAGQRFGFRFGICRYRVRVDIGLVSLLSELRAHEQQAATEIERWKIRTVVETTVAVTPVAIALSQVLTTDELKELKRKFLEAPAKAEV